MSEFTNTVIVGGGQAGLATSYCLMQRGVPHIVLEQASGAGNVWRNERWDSFTLVTPNWATRMPGAEYQGGDPNSFMSRDDLVAYFEQYVTRHALPVRYDTRVQSVEPEEDDKGYIVRTNNGDVEAENVVMATGLYQKPKVPAFATELPSSIVHLPSTQYRNPESLPPGAVLVVGSAQSGCQIVEDLHLAGRKVYLATSGAGRVPRRYRGRDFYEWLLLAGFFDSTPDKLPSPKAKFGPNPHVSGARGGRSLNLHQFARDGVTLLGHLRGANERRLTFAPDLADNLARADKLETDLVKLVDGYIENAGVTAPEEQLLELRDGYAAKETLDLDLAQSGIRTIIWAMGYSFDFNLVKALVFDEDGYPVQTRGATSHRGLYFVGLPWLYKRKSGLLLGVGDDAAHIADAIAGELRDTT